MGERIYIRGWYGLVNKPWQTKYYLDIRTGLWVASCVFGLVAFIPFPYISVPSGVVGFIIGVFAIAYTVFERDNTVAKQLQALKKDLRNEYMYGSGYFNDLLLSAINQVTVTHKKTQDCVLCDLYGQECHVDYNTEWELKTRYGDIYKDEIKHFFTSVYYLEQQRVNKRMLDAQHTRIEID